jgi:hypothetical protein
VAGVAGAVAAALGVALGELVLAVGGVALAAACLGLAAGWASRIHDRLAGSDPQMRSLWVGVVLVVGVFALTITASVADIEEPAGRTLARATGWPALLISFAVLGYAMGMRRDAQGRRRPDWVFVGLASLLIVFTLVTLSARLSLIFFLA